MEKILTRFEYIIFELKNINKYFLLSCMILIDLVLTFLLSLSITIIKGNEVFEIDSLTGQSLADIFFITVIFAPIIETLIFQFSIIESALFFFRRLKVPNSILISVVISGVAFGVSHSYNIYYVLVTVLIGLLYGVFYVIAKNHRYMNAFMTVCIVHSCANLVGFIVDDWLELM